VSVQVSDFENFGLIMPAEFKHFPYREAHLIIPERESKDQAWMIKYYVWSAVTQRLEMRRKSFDLNEISDIKKRKIRADNIIRQINQALKAGKIYDPEKKNALQAEKAIRSGNVIRAGVAIDAFLQAKKKKRERTYQTYKSHIDKFTEYLRGKKLLEAPLSLITTEVVVLFLNDQEVSPRTYNNYLTSIYSFFSYFIKNRKVAMLADNPCKYIEKETTSPGKNIAYVEEQQKKILNYCKQKHHNYWVVCNFMYYTLARTNEMTKLRIQDIDLKHNKIFLRSQDSKNNEDRWITIPTQLRKIIEEEGWAELPPNYYLFGNPGIKPGLDYFHTRKLGYYFRYRILDKLDYDKKYTLYSWKHTGVIAAYRAGIPPADIRRQTGHKSWNSFEKYLFSLGLFENTTVLNNYPTLPG
jgi:integrase